MKKLFVMIAILVVMVMSAAAQSSSLTPSKAEVDKHSVSAIRWTDSFKDLTWIEEIAPTGSVLEIKSDGRVVIYEVTAREAAAYRRGGKLGLALHRYFQKTKVAVSMTGLNIQNAEIIAATLTGWTVRVPDPDDSTKTIANPESAKNAVERHLETLLIEVLKDAAGTSAATTAAEVERKKIDDALEGTKPKPATRRINQ